MNTRLRRPSALVLVLGLSLAVTGCGRYSWSSLKAQKAWKDGNAAYTAQDYARASEHYEYVLQTDPSRTEAHFYLANSYDNRYRPTRAGEPANDELIQKAVEHYKLASERAPDPEIKKLALRYLVAAYGQDKLNKPEEAEPIVRQIIQMEPNEPSNYFALSTIYEQSGRYDEAEAALVQAREMRPNDATVHSTLAGFYERQAKYDQMLASLRAAADTAPESPEGYYRLATTYEDLVRRGQLDAKTKMQYTMAGLEAVDRALEINENYTEAMVYKNLLLRQQALLEPNRARAMELIKQADALRAKAIEINTKRATGQGG